MATRGECVRARVCFGQAKVPFHAFLSRKKKERQRFYAHHIQRTRYDMMIRAYRRPPSLTTVSGASCIGTALRLVSKLTTKKFLV